MSYSQPLERAGSKVPAFPQTRVTAEIGADQRVMEQQLSRARSSTPAASQPLNGTRRLHGDNLVQDGRCTLAMDGQAGPGPRSSLTAAPQRSFIARQNAFLDPTAFLVKTSGQTHASEGFAQMNQG